MGPGQVPVGRFGGQQAGARLRGAREGYGQGGIHRGRPGGSVPPGARGQDREGHQAGLGG